MSFQDVAHWYTEQDDPPPPAPCEVVVDSCFECGQAFQCVAGDGERFCSDACESRWCRRALTASQTPPNADDDPLPL